MQGRSPKVELFGHSLDPSLPMQRVPPTVEERLVLAQVVHLLGAFDWQNVSVNVMKMSTERGKQLVLTPLECEAYWGALMRQQGVNLGDPEIADRVRSPQAPENLALVRRLFLYRLTELHQQIVERENTFRKVSNELSEIRSGGWDETLMPKKSQREPVVSVTAATSSSSSSQLSPIDSPIHTPVIAASTDQKGRDDMDMEVDEADVTVTQQPEGTDAEAGEEANPPLYESGAEEDSKDRSKGKSDIKEEDEDEDAEDDEDEDDEDEAEKPAPTRGLRSRKAPVLEPLEIPAAPASPKSSRKGKGHKASDSTSQPSARGRRRGGPDSAKPPHSPATASAAGTFESAPTPAATDENASVVDDGGRRRSTRGHKRKASEMDVDLPGPSLSKKMMRDRSTTVEDEPMTPAVPSSATGRFSNPKLKQAMTQIIILLNNTKHAEIFRRPVTKKEAPDYPQAVQRPTDLTTIQRAIKAGQIVSWDELERELRRMLANCCVYNRPGTGAYEMAKLMLNEVEQMLEVAREGAGDVK